MRAIRAYSCDALDRAETAPGARRRLQRPGPALAQGDFARFVEECRLADVAAAGKAFDHTFALRDETYSLRFGYVHMIGEYARHNGPADLLRELVDGTTGA